MQILFESETEYGMYRDVLCLEDDHSLSEDEINLLKQERVDNWLAFVKKNSEPDIININGNFYEKIDVDGQIMLIPVGSS